MPSKIRGVAVAAVLVVAVSGCGGRGIDPGNEAATDNGSRTSDDMFEQDIRNVGPMGTGDLGGGANMIDTSAPGENAGAGQGEIPEADGAPATVSGGGTTSG